MMVQMLVRLMAPLKENWSGWMMERLLVQMLVWLMASVM